MNKIVLILLLIGGIYAVMHSVVPAPKGADVLGVAYVHDGDTFTVAGVKIRLFGVDAPEHDQSCQMPDGSDWACGKWASDKVRALLKGQQLQCFKRAYDKYGRMVARCYLGGHDLAKMLVSDGIVFSYASFSRDYLKVEKQAEAAGRGLWRAKTVSPAEFRRQKRAN